MRPAWALATGPGVRRGLTPIIWIRAQVAFGCQHDFVHFNATILMIAQVFRHPDGPVRLAAQRSTVPADKYREMTSNPGHQKQISCSSPAPNRQQCHPNPGGATTACRLARKNE